MASNEALNEKQDTVAPVAQESQPKINGNKQTSSDKQESKQEKHDEKSPNDSDKKKKKDKDKEPEGGFDDTPIPHAPPGYTLKITFHRASNLPFADINSLSSDPFVLAQLNTGLQPRHKEDPHLRMRTNTIRRNVDPEWNFEWIVANVPGSGFKLKARIYDEDPADHDDRLGNVHVNVGRFDEHWEGIKNGEYKVRKRMGSKRAYAVRFLAVCFKRVEHWNARLYISIEVLGRSPGDDGGRCFTVGQNWWTKHYSPILGRIAGRKETKEDDEMGEPANGEEKEKQEKKKAQRYK